MSARVVLLGCSGHAAVVAETLNVLGYEIAGYAQPAASENNLLALKYLGSESDPLSTVWKHRFTFAMGIGDNALRQSVYGFIRDQGSSVITLIHPQANVSKYSKIGEGTFVARGCQVNPFVHIGENCILNTASSIDHECLVGDHSHIAPGTVLCGCVNVGTRVFVGAGAVVKQNIKIGDGATVGAGSLVLEDVPPGQTWFGSPAKRVAP